MEEGACSEWKESSFDVGVVQSSVLACRTTAGLHKVDG